MDFDDLKEVKPKRLLKNFNFKYEGAHLAVTDGTKGGAASMKNEAYLFKALDDGSNESDSAVADTAVVDGNTGVTADVSVSKSNDNNEDNMTAEVMKSMQEQIEALQKQLEAKEHEVAVEKAATAFAKYELEAELVKELSEAFQGEAVELVVKALNAMKAAEAVAVEKAKEQVAPVNEIAKALTEEKAEGGEPEQQQEKTLVEKTMEVLKSKLENK